MAVFRIEKTRDYTVMSNHHLRDMSLSLKAKGLLSLMLSLPENWDYTMKGLSRICKDGIDSISGGIRELEEHGYLIRERVRGANGQLGSIEYTILEQPKEPTPAQEKPIRENPVQANPTLVTPIQEEPAQLNKDRSSNDAVIAKGSEAAKDFIAEFTGIATDDQVLKALQMACELQLIVFDSSRGCYGSPSFLARKLVSASSDEQKAVFMRLILEQYAPYNTCIICTHFEKTSRDD